MKYIDKILNELSFRVSDGMPDFTNEQHLIKLYDILNDLNWDEEVINELLYNLSEGEDKVPNPNPKTKERWPEVTPETAAKYLAKQQDGAEEDGTTTKKPEPEESKPVDRTKFDKRSAKPKKSKQEYPSLQALTDSLGERDKDGNINLDVLIKSQKALHIDRAKGNAGMGGAVASEGESKFTDVASDDFEYPDSEDEKARVEKHKKNIKEKRKKGKYPNAEEKQILEALGLKPDSPEALEYMATREAYAEKQLDEIKKDKDSVYYKIGKAGFGGNKKPRPEEPTLSDPPTKKELAAHKKWEKKAKAWDEKEKAAEKAYKDWMKAAYDGGQETKRMLKDNKNFDETKPHKCVQSDPNLDDAVEGHLENEVKKSKQKYQACTDTPEGERKEKGFAGDPYDCSIENSDYVHYKNQHRLFHENRKYHDTYVIGHDKEGRMSIVSISNKKGGDMKDTQNNMTPKGRFFSIKKILGDEVAETVATALDDGIRKVTRVQKTSRETSATVKIDDTIVGRIQQKGVLSSSRRDNIDVRGQKRERRRVEGDPEEGPFTGKPSRGSEFGCWLEDQDPSITPERWEELNEPGNEKELLELMAKFNGDVDWHKANTTPVKMKDDVTDEPVDKNGRTKEQYDALSDEEKEEQGEWEQGTETWQPPYDPFTKTFIKIGEAVKHDELTEWKRKRKAEGKDPDTDIFNKERLAELEEKVEKGEPLTEEEKCLMMKLREQESVNQAHAGVIKSIDEADKNAEGGPFPDAEGNNGPHARGYIRSVMESLHFTRYIRMNDDDAESMIIQMGIEGAKPTDIRDCLADLSGYKPVPPDDPEDLIKHLEKKCKLNQSTTPPTIQITNDDGDQSLMEDTWRTAGTSQKVASGFGDSMRECIKGKAKARRPSSKEKSVEGEGIEEHNLDLLTEDWIDDKWYPAHTKSALKWALMRRTIPIYPKTMEKIIGKIPITSFHVTTLDHLDNVTRLLGTKKSMSTFTRMGKDSQLAKGKGIQTEGGVVFWLEGTLLARKYIDMQSEPDKTGRRWISSLIVFGREKQLVPFNAAKRKKIPDRDEWQDYEWEVKDKLMKKYGGGADNIKEYEAEVKKVLNKRANEIITAYITLSNNLLKKHKKLVKKNLSTPSRKGSSWWNEILIYNAKIKEIFVMSRASKKDLEWGDSKQKASLEKLISTATGDNPITIGTPAKYRKWYTDRKGKLDVY